ncbi:related to protein kinase Gin4p [Fusarium oxysporum]|uniref:non-specific serine/threonine protein kinase n=1 Tax=Fusarium oxysporum TaxID=5507 RepID=A0A2H3TD47_FUSOX|nr:related to protein kinase Gin4p [Fusarium oxysporum]
MADTMVSTVRSPLSEASNRINSNYPTQEGQRHKPRYDRPNSSIVNNTARTNYGHPTAYFSGRPPTQQQPTVSTPQEQATLKPPSEMDDERRHSAASYDSSGSGRSKKNYKTHIGPWQLGRTLGKGSSARVRLCRHTGTNQLAAVKIVNRRMAYLVQDSSLAALSKWDNHLPEQIDGEMRVPMAIEREVAILKLIEHPNIMKLYDIWENRSEVYLILEYIDQGDLFTFINMKGRLSEEVSIFFFRQIISAISYCHSFNICHRDLKPENILISADLQIKIADFGMAALHQTDTHQLATACGSPHYAAPELLKNRQYRGDRADIWSMGVILFAMLSATLPFDDPDLRVMMARTKKGQYEMPSFLSLEAEDLIRRMLQVNPDRRITLKDIWRHPLIRKYAYLDNLSDINSQPPDIRKGFQYTQVPTKDVDPQLVRQLRSMWHMFSENDLKLKLTCDEPNDQKAFYWLLYHYREQQLEDFKPELAHSTSDYHHMKPGTWKKRVSTCEFAQPSGNGHGRSISRFTVISNATEPEPALNQEPFQTERAIHSRDSQKGQSLVSVHRYSYAENGSYTGQPKRLRSGSGARRGRGTSTRNSTTGRLQSSRGSLSSMHSSRQGTPHARSLRHKRGVDFTHVRKRSTSSSNRNRSGSMPPYVTEQGSTYQIEMIRSHTPELPSLPSGVLPKLADGQEPQQRSSGQALRIALGSRYASEIFKEELRHFSSNIAKDCDEAFKSSLIEEDSIAGSLTEPDHTQYESTPFSFTIDAPEDSAPDVLELSNKSFSNRPLPPLPTPTPSYNGNSLAPTPTGSRPVTGESDSEELRAEQVKVAQPVVLTRHAERRVVSAPTYTQKHKRSAALPSINEAGAAASDKARIVSAPPHTPTKKGVDRIRGIEYLSQVENSIRVVHSPGDESPVKIPEPLNVRKKVPEPEQRNSAPAAQLREPDSASQRSVDGGTTATTLSLEPPSHDAQAVTKKKKMSWFKRSSKVESEPSRESVEWQDCTSYLTSSDGKRSDSTSTEAPTKKKTFHFSFWKSNKQRDSIMSIARPDQKEERPSLEFNTMGKTHVSAKVSQSKWHESGSGPVRNIEVKQNWLARLFRVKPATDHICMTISRRRARQEVTILLREWRKYGIRDIQVDKQRNIVFARIAAKNFLNLKEVSFAAEVITVIEHGKKQPLSIIRFTQERGAASSFHRVVDTMNMIFDARALVVADRNKRKMMIKTLNS